MINWRLRPLAEVDIEAIADYTAANWGQTQALRYLNELRAGFDQLCIDTWRGSPVFDRHDSMLRYRVGGQIVVFGREGAAVDIVRVLHERMDIDSQLDT